MAGVLVIGSVEAGRLSDATGEAISLAANLAEKRGCPLIGALAGSDISSAAATMATLGLSRLLAAQDARLAGYSGGTMLAAAEAFVRESGADVIVVPADAESIEWGPRLAARLGAALATNCVGADVEGSGAEGAIIATRALAGGVLRGDFRVHTPVAILLLSPGISVPPPAGGSCAIEQVVIGSADDRVTLIEFVPDEVGSGPLLKNARLVVSGGLGIGSADNWSLIEEAAGALGAAVGATRAAVDVGWAPSSRQVGFSGLTVAPDLYVAVGVSGALHHLAGISRAKKVVAINSDAEANIFKAAHLGAVGNALEVLPAFSARVREIRG